MKESGKNAFIGKKGYEISYALWRIAAHTKESALADKFYDIALDLIVASADEDYRKIIRLADALDYIIKFAVDVNCIEHSNAAIMVRESGNLKAAIADYLFIPANNPANPEIFDISDIFTSVPEKEEEDYIPEISIPAEPIIFETANLESGNESGNRSEMRQSAILERIRQSGNCRLADIQAILPGASERTLRYDLESLIQKNLIERMGAGGRSVYYRAK